MVYNVNTTKYIPDITGKSFLFSEEPEIGKPMKMIVCDKNKILFYDTDNLVKFDGKNFETEGYIYEIQPGRPYKLLSVRYKVA